MIWKHSGDAEDARAHFIKIARSIGLVYLATIELAAAPAEA